MISAYVVINYGHSLARPAAGRQAAKTNCFDNTFTVHANNIRPDLWHFSPKLGTMYLSFGLTWRLNDFRCITDGMRTIHTHFYDF